MGFLDRLLGRPPAMQGGYAESAPPSPNAATSGRGASEDERAIARYRYLLRTAPPESLERVHAEAFAQLTPEQREQVLAELSSGLPAGEAVPTSDPQSLARAATRAELRQPGYLENTFSRGRFAGGGGVGMGGTIMGSMMGTMAGFVIGSAIADVMFDGYDTSPEAADVGESSSGAADGGDSSPGGGDGGTDPGTDSGTDTAHDSGGFDADSGGFDSGGFGGGDFGGGNLGGF